MKNASFFVFYLFCCVNVNSLKSIDDYVSSVEGLMLNEEFLSAYIKRSLELFSQPDYLYGQQSNHFPCEIPAKDSESVTKTVHHLTPSDIQCVGAIGDSLTAALGAHAATPVGLFTENRGDKKIQLIAG